MKTLKPASEMDPDEIFSNLPPEIILNILLRIPIKSVFTCKCVCKSWLELLESPEFARSHLSYTVPALLIHHPDDTNDMDIFKIFGSEDSLEIECHELHYKIVLELKSENMFGNSLIAQIYCSTNGLLFFRNSFPKHDDYYICNPISHECLKLPKPEGIPGSGTVFAHGFGVSRLSNQYKVVMIFRNFVCQVYTLGTGSWRSVMAPSEKLLDRSTGQLLNGNLHWLTFDLMGTVWVSRFDVETEVFIKFRAPTLDLEEPPTNLGVLRDRLCVSDFSSMNEIVIYLMTDDGYETESWNKEYVISKIPGLSGGAIDAICPLKAFGDGDLYLLLAQQHACFLCYSTRTKTVALVDVLNDEIEGYYSEAILYAPSFISLNDFETENAKLFELVCSMS